MKKEKKKIPTEEELRQSYVEKKLNKNVPVELAQVSEGYSNVTRKMKGINSNIPARSKVVNKNRQTSWKKKKKERTHNNKSLILNTREYNFK